MPRMLAIVALAACFVGGPAAAQEDTVEELASDAEVTSVGATLAKIDCRAPSVEKESAELFEVDDATCEIGQYDIKLDEDYNIVSMTRDE